MTEGITPGIRQGDGIAALEALPPGSVDLVFTDPPFNIGYRYDDHDDRMKPEDYLAFTAAWTAAAARALTPAGSLVVVIGDEYADELGLLARGRWAVGDIPPRPRDQRLVQKQVIVWYYTFGVHCSGRLTRSHTLLKHFVRPGDRDVWNRPRVPSARQRIYRDKRATAGGRTPDDVWILRPQDHDSPLCTPAEDTWHVPRVCGTHRERIPGAPNQLPEALVDRVIGMTTRPGALVVDPFTGSGTIPCVAKRRGRVAVGFDKSATDVERATSRWEQTIPQPHQEIAS